MLDRPYSLDNTVRIDQPLIFVSQIQRSGGSFFTRLFDNHHQIYTLPIEMYCLKNEWLKKKDINNLSKFYLRHNPYMQRYVFKGFDKGSRKLNHRINFDFNFGLQEEIINRTEASSKRESLDRFFTSFFNAWTNFKNIQGEKKFVLAFAPRTIQDIWKHNPDPSFYSAYPHGYIISIIREPKNWYSSAEKHSSSYTNPNKAFNLYNSCLKASLEVKRNNLDRTILINFSDLILHTKDIMKMICEKTGVDFKSNLLEPTFNSTQTKSNSSHKRVFKVDESVLEREPKKRIDGIDSFKKAKKLYEEAHQYFDGA